MKIYVDGELPECCNDCEFGYFYDCQYCSLRPDLAREDIWVEKEKYCPLQSLADYTKQVRKEVCEKIREWHDEEERNIDRLVENVENLCSNDLKPMWDKWHEEMTKQIKETIKGEEDG